MRFFPVKLSQSFSSAGSNGMALPNYNIRIESIYKYKLWCRTKHQLDSLQILGYINQKNLCTRQCGEVKCNERWNYQRSFLFGCITQPKNERSKQKRTQNI